MSQVMLIFKLDKLHKGWNTDCFEVRNLSVRSKTKLSKRVLRVRFRSPAKYVKLTAPNRRHVRVGYNKVKKKKKKKKKKQSFPLRCMCSTKYHWVPS